MGDAVAQSLLSSQPPSVIAVLVNETKIFELDPSIDIPGWSWLRGWEFDPACTPAQRTMRGQGVFVRNHWSRDLSVLSKHPSHLWLELRRRKRQPLVICSVYLPPIGAFSSCSLGTEHPRRFTRPEFLRTLSLIFAEARGFARGPPTRQFLVCGDFNAELHPREAHRPAHNNLWSAFSTLLASQGIQAVCPLGGFRDTFFATRAGALASSSVDHVLVNSASSAPCPSVSISDDLRPLLGNAADHRSLAITLPGSSRPCSQPSRRPDRTSPHAKFIAPHRPIDQALLAESVSKLLEASPPPPAPDEGHYARESLAEIDEATSNLNTTLREAATSALLPAMRSLAPHARHRSALHRKRFEAAKRKINLGFAVVRTRKHLASADPSSRLLLSAQLDQLSSQMATESSVIKSISRAIRVRRLLKAGTNFEDLSDCPARQWQNEKHLRGSERAKTPAQFRDSNGRLATSQAEVLKGWADYAKANSTDSEIGSAPIAALHARLRAQELIRLARGPSAAEQAELDGPITTAEISRALRHIRAHAAAGPDGIQPFLLKFGGARLVLALHSLFNRIWFSETWPSDWQEGIISYIVKSGPGRIPSNPADHRPITLLSVIGKCFERVLHYRLQGWSEARKRISDAQNGFRPGRNCDDNLLFLTETLRSRLAQGLQTVLIFYDVAAAYDQVDRALLFHALGSQCCGRFYNMVKTIISKVSRQVSIDQSLSEKFDLDMGVPQGSVLSPILFNLTINPIVQCLASGPFNATTIFGDGELSASAFADDLLSILHDPDDIQAELDRVGAVADAHRIHFSASKTQVVLVTPDSSAKTTFSLRSWSLQGKRIGATDEYRYHGVYIGAVRATPTLGGDREQPTSHVLDWSGTLREKAASFRRRMSSLFRSHCSPSGLSTASASQIFRQELRPILDFACTVMDLSPTEIKTIRNLQNRALRLFLFGSTDKGRYSEWLLCNEFGVLPWHHRRAELQLRYFGRLVDLRNSDHGSQRTKIIVSTLHRKFLRWMRRLHDNSFAECRCPALASSRPDWRLWHGSIFKSWCDTHRAYGLIPSWRPDDDDGGVPSPFLDSPALASWIEARLFRPPFFAGGDVEAAEPPTLDIRTRVIRGAVLALAQRTWETDRLKLSRQRHAGANHLGNGITRRAIPRRCGHPVGRLVMCAARSGAIPLSVELHRIDKLTPPLCPLCGLADETVLHFALHCPAYTGPRSLLRADASRLLSPRLLGLFLDPATPPSMKFALLSDPGPARWPSFFPIPTWACRSSLPLLARLLEQLHRPSRLDWHQACTNFFARAWRVRCIAVSPDALSAARPPNDALMVAALRDRTSYPQRRRP